MSMTGTPPARSITARYGSKLGIACFKATLRFLGLRAAYLLLWLVVPWYFLFRPSVRRSTYHYLSRRFPSLA